MPNSLAENFVDEKERAESLVTSWIQHQPTPMVKAAQTQYDKVNNFSRSLTDSVDDEEGEEEEVSQRESKISRDAHTLNVNSFLSSSGSEFSGNFSILISFLFLILTSCLWLLTHRTCVKHSTVTILSIDMCVCGECVWGVCVCGECM